MIVELNANNNNSNNILFVSEEEIEKAMMLGKYAMHDSVSLKMVEAIRSGKQIYHVDNDKGPRPANIEVKYLRERKIKFFERVALFAKTSLEVSASGVGGMKLGRIGKIEHVSM